MAAHPSAPLKYHFAESLSSFFEDFYSESIIDNKGKQISLPGKDVHQGFFGGLSSSDAVPSFFGVMSMASGSCKPFLKFRTLSPIPRLISGIFLPPKTKKMTARMMISSQNPKPNKTIPLRVPGVYSIPLRG
jgi:hypothetical protein